ncbi:MAG: hypothetical protein CL878_14635 [Dehalococcoidia bacterium]|nr:hypothetical protein [Dehalococcoidia bacterium]
MADTSNPEWIDYFIRQVEEAVNSYDLDAIYVDAAQYEVGISPAPLLWEMLHERLPALPKGAIGFSSWRAWKYITFSMSARSDHQAPSPVMQFVQDYVRIIPHLCEAPAFVPVASVCNPYPERRSPLHGDALHRALGDAQRYHYTPGLRLNYRRYGLDADTRRALQTLAGE